MHSLWNKTEYNENHMEIITYAYGLMQYCANHIPILSVRS